MEEPYLKTSVQVKADLWRRLKIRAAEQNTTITKIVNVAIEREVNLDA